MKTKLVPAIVMLTGGAVCGVLLLRYDYNGIQFTKMILIVLLIFYVIGSIIKLILDKNFPEETEEETEGQEGEEGEEGENVDGENPEEEKENIESEGESQDEE